MTYCAVKEPEGSVWWSIVSVVCLTDERGFEILVIANLQHPAIRIWTCAEPEFRVSWIRCDNYAKDASERLFLVLFFKKQYFRKQLFLRYNHTQNISLLYDTFAWPRRIFSSIYFGRWYMPSKYLQYNISKINKWLKKTFSLVKC